MYDRLLISLGANDIKNHRFYKKLDWDLILQKKLPAPYKPPIKYTTSCYSLLIFTRGKGDTSNYSTYPDSTELPKAVKPSEDPFIGW